MWVKIGVGGWCGLIEISSQPQSISVEICLSQLSVWLEIDFRIVGGFSVVKVSQGNYSEF